MHVGSKTINGVECEVHASDLGVWDVKDPDGRPIGRSESSLDAAVNAARVALNKRKVKVDVPFVTMKGKRGVATGFHAGTAKILTTIDGHAEQLERYTKVLRHDTPADTLSRLAELRTAETDARRAIGAIEREYSMDLRGAVDKAMTDAAS